MTDAPTTRETADHAELARECIRGLQSIEDRVCEGDPFRFTGGTIYFKSINALETLLSEIAALRGEKDGLKNRVSCLERLGGEQSTRVMEQATRAKDAERQRDELRKALERIAYTPDGEDGLSLNECVDLARQTIATQGAKQ